MVSRGACEGCIQVSDVLQNPSFLIKGHPTIFKGVVQRLQVRFLAPAGGPHLKPWRATVNEDRTAGAPRRPLLGTNPRRHKTLQKEKGFLLASWEACPLAPIFSLVRCQLTPGLPGTQFESHHFSQGLPEKNGLQACSLGCPDAAVSASATATRPAPLFPMHCNPRDKD